VGLAYIALVGPGVERCERHVWEEGGRVPDRVWNKALTARRALYALIEALEERIQRADRHAVCLTRRAEQAG